MSKIRFDKNGRPYAITNGGVYRPQTGPHESPVPQRNWGKGIESKISIGTDIQIKKINQSPFCKIRTADGLEEMWTVHGYDVKNPEACFYEQAPARTPDGNFVSSLMISARGGEPVLKSCGVPRSSCQADDDAEPPHQEQPQG